MATSPKYASALHIARQVRISFEKEFDFFCWFSVRADCEGPGEICHHRAVYYLGAIFIVCALWRFLHGLGGGKNVALVPNGVRERPSQSHAFQDDDEDDHDDDGMMGERKLKTWSRTMFDIAMMMRSGHEFRDDETLREQR